MTIALYAVAALLVALLVMSAGLKLSGRSDVIESYARVGVSRSRLTPLAAVLVAGALGVVGGFIWTPLGVTAAVALVVYFVLALIAHATHDDLAHAARPALLRLLACGTAVLFALEL
jgi:hypothetical protein